MLNTAAPAATATCKWCSKPISKPSKTATRWHDMDSRNSTIRCVWSRNAMRHEPTDA